MVSKCLYFIFQWVKEQIEEEEEVEIKVDEENLIESQSVDPAVVKQLNSNTSAIVLLQSHQNDIARIAKQDRDGVRRLRDEMLDYIENSTTLADETDELNKTTKALQTQANNTQAELLMLTKDYERLKENIMEHMDDTEIHRPTHNTQVFLE